MIVRIMALNLEKTLEGKSVNKLSFRELIDEAKKKRKWPKINSGYEGSDDIDEPSDVREDIKEEWIIVDKHKNAVISKHGDDQKAATIAARKMDFAEWNKTHKLGRFCPMATHGPGAMAPDVANLDPGGKPKPKKKAASKAKTAKKPTGKAAPAAKKPSPAKAKAKTPGQGGGLGSQIGSLIAKHMSKMFKEEHELNEIDPKILKSYMSKPSSPERVEAFKKFRQTNAQNYLKFRQERNGGSSQPTNNSPNNSPTNNKLPRVKAADWYQNQPKPQPKTKGVADDDDYKTLQKKYNTMRMQNSIKNWSREPEKPSLLHSVGHGLAHTAVHVLKHALMSSVNYEVERILFETEEQPNYHVQILLDSGNIGNKSFRRHSISTVRPVYTGAPNEPLDEKWLNRLITSDEQIKHYQDEGYHIADIIGSNDPYQSEREMNERHAKAVRTQDAIARRFLPRDEE